MYAFVSSGAAILACPDTVTYCNVSTIYCGNGGICCMKSAGEVFCAYVSRYTAMQYAHTIQYNTIQYNTIQYNTIQYNTIQCNAIQYNTMQCNAMQCNAMQCNTMQYN